MLYLYAVIDQPGVEFALPRGLGDTELDILPFDGLGVVAGRLPESPRRDAVNAHRHMEVLTALMQRCTVLPGRFGAVFAGRADLDRSIAALHDGLAADLLRLRGQVELGMKAADRKPLILKPVHEGPQLAPVPDSEMGPGMRYVTTRRVKTWQSLRLMRANEAIAAVASAAFAPLTTNQSWHPLPSAAGRAGIAAAFLLPRARLEAFQEALAELRGEEAELDIRCTGPWPPYSFVSSHGRTLFAWACRGEAASRIAS